MPDIMKIIFDKPYQVTLSALSFDNSQAELGTVVVTANTKYGAMIKAMEMLWRRSSDITCCKPSAIIKPATCQYFHKDYVGFCGAAAFPYIPSIRELRSRCFENFLACPIYSEFQAGNTFATGEAKYHETRVRISKACLHT
jgi:hypothetical protein